MKKFENPIINVSLFDVENIVTASGSDTPDPALPLALDEAKKQAGIGTQDVITITF